MSRTMVIIIAVVALVVIAGIGSQMGGTPAASQAPAAGDYSDAQIKAIMVGNLGDAGLPTDVAVTDKVLIVSTTDPSDPEQTCSNVRAFTNDPDTAAPLGVIGVVIISGGTEVARC